MPYRAVLFDLDGTLLNTLEDLADSMNAVLARRGHPEHPVADYRFFVGQGIAEMCRVTLPEDRRDKATVAALVNEMGEEYGRRWADKTRPYPDVPEMLEKVAARGLPMVVFSNKPHEFTTMTVERFLADVPFHSVLGVQPGVPGKPDPTAPLRLADELGVAPAEVCYLGDTANDMHTATAAGMFPVGARWGFRPDEELMASGAQWLLTRPLELLGLLG